MKLLLDTSAYVGFKRNVAKVVDTIVRAESILFSPVVLGELIFGFRNGTRFEENMQELDDFLQHDVVRLVKIGEITSDRYSRIAVQLKGKGAPIPTNDIWIAAQTMEQGAELITSDRHFEKIDGLVCTIL
ncbi:MAG: type II toxin-antitoxin system VapC family toxin [Thermodesulfobacteriota bacterium]|nr:type II toxin-antitoxin system VapC family toxin [Thermodesulfobacteriota bacterium]